MTEQKLKTFLTEKRGLLSRTATNSPLLGIPMKHCISCLIYYILNWESMHDFAERKKMRFTFDGSRNGQFSLRRSRQQQGYVGSP